MNQHERPPIAAWVKTRRKAVGYKTQDDLANAMGEDVSASYVGNLESGRTYVPRQPFLRQLADALHVSEMTIIRAAGLLTEPEPNGASAVAEATTTYDALPPDEQAILDAYRALSERHQQGVVDMLGFLTDMVEPSLRPRGIPTPIDHSS